MSVNLKPMGWSVIVTSVPGAMVKPMILTPSLRPMHSPISTDLSVKADEGATYYIGGKNRTAVIRTDTDFGTAAFIIDDTDVQNRNTHVFMVSSSLQPFKPEGISSLKRNQEKIDVSLPGTCLVTVTNSNIKRYIRFGPNQNNGSPQTDIFIVDKNGNVDMDAPIIWDFDQITDITPFPLMRQR